MSAKGLAEFEGPAEELAGRVLLAQMRLGGASGGALLADMGDGRFDLLATAPAGSGGAATPAPAWLEACRSGIGTAIVEARAIAGMIDSERSAVVIPCDGSASIESARGLVLVFIVESTDPVEVDAARERLADAAVLTAVLRSRLALSEVAGRESALRHACEAVGAMGAHESFASCSMVLVNEAASRLGASRVALGLVFGRDVRAVAISHTERFVRAGAMVREIEAAMEEAVDQDADTAFPHEDSAPFIARQAAEASRRHGPCAVGVMVIRTPGRPEPVGALLVERDPDRPMDESERVWLRLLLDLSAPRLVELEERDAGVVRRVALRTRRGLAAAASPKGAGWKLGVLGAALAVASLFVIPTDLKARGTFIAEAPLRRVVAAPFDGVLDEIGARVGDRVKAGQTLLGALDATELSLRLTEASAQRDALLRQAEAARAGPSSGGGSIGAIAESRLFEAQAKEADARVKLLESRIAKSRLVAPIDGVVVVGDIEKLRGAAVATGDTLFEIVPEEGLVATVAVPEARAADIAVGQRAALTPTGRPDQSIDAEVERIAPMAEVVNMQNVVRVRVRLTGEAPAWLRPGMEGVGGITTGRASLMRSWTRGATDWLRMKLWW